MTRAPQWIHARPLVALCSALCALLGCARPGLGHSPTDDLEPNHKSAATIPLAPLSGTIVGVPFAMKHATCEIDRRPGYESITVRFHASKPEHPCSRPSGEEPSLWLRFGGVTALEPGEVSIRPKGEGPFTAHLEVRRDGRWYGNGDAAAVLLIDRFDRFDQVSGALSVCFADGTKSCASGAFEAEICPIALDRAPRHFDGISRREIDEIRAQLADAGAEVRDAGLREEDDDTADDAAVRDGGTQ